MADRTIPQRELRNNVGAVLRAAEAAKRSRSRCEAVRSHVSSLPASRDARRSTSTGKHFCASSGRRSTTTWDATCRGRTRGADGQSLAGRVSGSLLDTSVLIAPDATGLGKLPPVAAISIISIGELNAGVLLAKNSRIREARRLRLNSVRSAFSPLAVDEPELAESYGEILGVARWQGRRPGKAPTDLLIVATAVGDGPDAPYARPATGPGGGRRRARRTALTSPSARYPDHHLEE